MPERDGLRCQVHGSVVGVGAVSGNLVRGSSVGRDGAMRVREAKPWYCRVIVGFGTGVGGVVIGDW